MRLAKASGPMAIVFALLAVSPLLRAGGQRQALHPKAFWQDIAKNKFAVPAGESVPELVRELSGFLASPDPELRDDIAYATLANWIYRQRIVPVELRRSLLTEWTTNLSRGVGESGTDSIFRRSFSALSLGILVILDNEAPWLEKPEFDRLLDAAVAYFAAERDIRGFDEQLGWMHSVAHTADLLKFMARSRHLSAAQQSVVLDAISRKLGSVSVVLTHGEDERLARAVLSIAARTDFDDKAFQAWATSLSTQKVPTPPTSAGLAAAQNRKHLFVSLYAVLSVDTRALPTLQTARAIVLGALKALN